MGWDISYHPFAPEEVQTIYFNGIDRPEHYKAISETFAVDAFYTEQMRLRFEEARNLDPLLPFNKGHAFYIAIISGFLRKFWYLRGAAFTFLLERDEAFESYVTDWRQLVPSRLQDGSFDNQLTENYCGGVFLAPEALRRLRADYSAIPEIKALMDEGFSHGRLEIFWKAVDWAIDNNLGLIEASEIVEPNPFDLNTTHCYTNLMNCQTDGALLYAETAAHQLGEAVTSAEAGQPAPDDRATSPEIFGFIWRGAGYAGLLIPIVIAVVGQLGVDFVMGAGYHDSHPSLGAGLIVLSAIAVWFLGKRLNSRSEGDAMAAETQQAVMPRAKHTIFCMPLQYFAFVLMGLALIGVFFVDAG